MYEDDTIKERVCMKIMRTISILMVFIMLSASPVCALATAFPDMPNDWSTNALQEAVNNGLLTGGSDGNLRPNDNLTRAELAATINRAFGASVEADISGFPDVPSGQWYTPELAKAVQMGTFEGSDGYLYPDQAITREEAFVVVARALHLEESTSPETTFSDAASISPWATEEVYAMINTGCLSGANGRLKPKDNITRAEFAVVMHNMIKGYITSAGVVTQVPAGNVMINTPGVILKNVTVQGDLIIGDGVGAGEVTLDNVTVTGRTVIRGGGKHSVRIISNSLLAEIIVSNPTGGIQVIVSDNSQVQVMAIDDGVNEVIVQGPIGTLNIEAGGQNVVLENAQIRKVNILAGMGTLQVGAGSAVDQLKIANGHIDVTVAGRVGTIETVPEHALIGIVVVQTGHIEQIDANTESLTVDGTGYVGRVNANADNVRVGTPNTVVSAGDNTTGIVAADSEVNPGESKTINSTGKGTISTGSSGGGSSSGSDRDRTPPAADAVAIGNTIVLSFTEAVNLYKNKEKVTNNADAWYKTALKVVPASAPESRLAISAVSYTNAKLTVTMSDPLTVGATYYMSLGGGDTDSYLIADASGNTFSPTDDRVRVTAALPAMPTVSSFPTSVETTVGTLVTLNVTASAANGAQISYCWQKRASAAADWSDISNTTQTSCSVENVALSDNGSQYRCILKASQYGATSEATETHAVTLTVNLNAFNVNISSDILSNTQSKLWFSNGVLDKDKSAAVTIVVTDAQTNQPVPDATVTLASDNAAVAVNAPASVTTGADGKASFTIEAISAGTASLTPTVTKTDWYLPHSASSYALTSAAVGNTQLFIGNIPTQALIAGSNKQIPITLTQQTYHETVPSIVSDYTGFTFNVQSSNSGKVAASFDATAKTLTLTPAAASASPVTITLEVSHADYDTAEKEFTATVSAAASGEATVRTEAELRAALADASVTSIKVDTTDLDVSSGDLTISKPLTVPEGDFLSIMNGTATVSAGITLTINGQLYVDESADFTPETGASMIGFGTFEVGVTTKAGFDKAVELNFGDIMIHVRAPINMLSETRTITSAVTGGSLSIYIDHFGSFTGEFTNWGNIYFDESVWIIGGVDTEAKLRELSADSRIGVLDIQGDITLTQNLTISGGRYVSVMSYVALTVSSGRTLTISKGSTLDNGGTVVNNGTIRLETGGTCQGTPPTKAPVTIA